jgi:hypothetical protein
VRGADLHVDGRVVRRADGSQQRRAGHADHGRKVGRPDVEACSWQDRGLFEALALLCIC